MNLNRGKLGVAVQPAVDSAVWKCEDPTAKLERKSNGKSMVILPSLFASPTMRLIKKKEEAVVTTNVLVQVGK